ncbi:hypothetical protein OSB04_012661 [Centaurea solstitialis]|uniref:Uncharacterized protein n=1 Tax=Centaurea solstitialis TaxID=347529 RepID=A0AA38WET1_9ASTR|nr:hypothetical protein OSB04_012661 [Centaurea solstitialis]
MSSPAVVGNILALALKYRLARVRAPLGTKKGQRPYRPLLRYPALDRPSGRFRGESMGWPSVRLTGAGISRCPYGSGYPRNWKLLRTIGNFIFHTDINIGDLPDDVEVPVILGRPFLDTVGAIVDMRYKTINLGIGDNRVTFSLNGSHIRPVFESFFRGDRKQGKGKGESSSLSKSLIGLGVKL